MKKLIFLILILAFSFIPADGQGCVDYFSPDGGTLCTGDYVLEGDVLLNQGSYFTIAKKTNVYLDLAGFTISGSGEDPVLVNRGVITIKGGTVEERGRITGGAGMDADGQRLGGAIYNSGRINLFDVLFEGNFADLGGAIYNTGVLSMEDVMMNANTANYGGAIYSDSGRVTITGSKSILQANIAKEYGSVIYADNATVTLNGGIYRGNLAEFRNANGGMVVAINNPYASLTIRKGTLTANTITANPDVGGAAALISAENGAYINFIGGVLKENNCSGANCSAGTALMSDASLNIQDGSFYENSCSGTACAGAVAVLDGSTFQMNGGEFWHVYANGEGAGTMIVGTNATFTQDGGTIKECAAEGKGAAGAVAIHSSGIFDMNGGTINKTAANGELSGGAVTLRGGDRSQISTFNLGDGKILKTECLGANCAAGVTMLDRAFFHMNGGSIIQNNTGTQTVCGGVYVGDNSVFTMRNGEISNNAGTTAGGVMVTGSGDFYMEDGSIISNSCTAEGCVAGVLTAGDVSFYMGKGEISQNACGAEQCTGGLAVSQSATALIDGGSVSDNTGGRTGCGGVHVYEGSFLGFSDGAINCNSADDGGVAGLWVDANSEAYISGGTISGNRGAQNGLGGVMVMEGGQLYASGTPVVSGNSVIVLSQVNPHALTEIKNNINLLDSNQLRILAPGLSSGAKMDITLASPDSGVATIDFEEYNQDDPTTNFFFSDDPDYAVGKNADGEVIFHMHVWEYSADPDSPEQIYAECSALGHSGGDALITLYYDDKAQKVRLAYDENIFPDVDEADIEYFELSGAPIYRPERPGKYLARYTFEGVTAELRFEIPLLDILTPAERRLYVIDSAAGTQDLTRDFPSR